MFLERLNRRLPLFLKPDPQIVIKALEGKAIDGISFKGRRFLNERYLAQFKQSGLDIYVWTINSPDRALYYEGIGVSGIITDNVAAVQQTVTTRQFTAVSCEQL